MAIGSGSMNSHMERQQMAAAGFAMPTMGWSPSSMFGGRGGPLAGYLNKKKRQLIDQVQETLHLPDLPNINPQSMHNKIRSKLPIPDVRQLHTKFEGLIEDTLSAVAGAPFAAIEAIAGEVTSLAKLSGDGFPDFMDRQAEGQMRTKTLRTTLTRPASLGRASVRQGRRGRKKNKTRMPSMRPSPRGSLRVASTEGFTPNGGMIKVGGDAVSYSHTTTNSFEGCQGEGKWSAGASVTQNSEEPVNQHVLSNEDSFGNWGVLGIGMLSRAMLGVNVVASQKMVESSRSQASINAEVAGRILSGASTTAVQSAILSSTQAKR